MSANNNTTTDEAAIRDLIENWAKAVRTKNLNGILELEFRLTMGLRKIGGQWTVMHEHHSIPAG